MADKKDGFDVLAFATPKAFNSWLKKNHAKAGGIWLRFYKKHSGIKTITYGEALDEALCFGWIDSIVNKYDEKSYIQKFSPRRSRSVWSKRNREHVARLTKEGRMSAAGRRQVDAAKKDGRWDAAYDSPENMKVPDEFMRLLKKNKRAYDFYRTLNRANKYAVGYRLQTAKKEETRRKRMNAIIQMFSAGKKFH